MELLREFSEFYWFCFLFPKKIKRTVGPKHLCYKIPFCFFIVFFLSGSPSSYCQKIIQGQVIDELSKEPLVFTNIGILNTSIGTVSNENGEFSIIIPDSLKEKSLTFSFVGYLSKSIEINKFNQKNDIVLIPKEIKLNELVVVEKQNKIKIKQSGVSYSFPGALAVAESENKNDIVEIGQVVSVGKKLSKIKSINIIVKHIESKEPENFRIKFYSFYDNSPQEIIINKELFFQQKILTNILSFNLEEENIVLKDQFFVSIEFLPSKNKEKETSSTLFFGAIIRNTGNTFIRKSSQGKWVSPRIGSVSMFIEYYNI